MNLYNEEKKKIEEEELEFYRNYVNNLANDKKDYQFPNSSKKHAAIVMSTIFKYAKERVYIYDDNLNGNIANFESDFYENIENFLKNGGILKIVINDEINIESPLYYRLNEFKNKNYNIELKKPDKKFIKSFLLKNEDKEDWNLYFTSADNSMIRIETDNKYKLAFCNFNNEKFSTSLISKMDLNIDSCTDVI